MSQFDSNIEKDVEKINVELKKLKNHSPYDEEITELIDDIISSGGKRIRPLICLLSYEMISNEERNDISYAAACAVEIIHNASLLIDDIFDKDIFRRKKKSFYLKFSTFSAISMSYSLSSLAFSLALKTKTVDVLDELIKASQNLSTSLFLEQKFRNGKKRMSKKEALLLIDRKTTALFEAASVIGGIVGNSSEKDRKNMKQFGTYFGRAFQLRDDILSIVSKQDDLGKSGVMTDIENRIQTYLLLEAMELADEEHKQILDEYYMEKRDYSIETIREIILTSGAIVSVKNKVNEYIEKAITILDEYPKTPPQKKLIEITNFLKIE